jgi:hypothetical protein
VSLVMSEKTRNRDLGSDSARTELGTKAAQGAGAGAVTGGGLGALIGGLIGYGIPEDRARQYDRGIREGGIVMGVTPRSRQDAEYFEREWTGCGAEQIYCPPLRGQDAA